MLPELLPMVRNDYEHGSTELHNWAPAFISDCQRDHQSVLLGARVVRAALLNYCPFMPRSCRRRDLSTISAGVLPRRFSQFSKSWILTICVTSGCLTFPVTVVRPLPAFFDLLREEGHPAVRVVLGHFIFVYIHPYMDGNGRVGRFLTNLMMASG
jgi:Fic/DOC family